MNDINAYLFPPALDAARKAQVRERIQVHRASVMDAYLPMLQDAAITTKLGAERSAALQDFISELLVLSTRAPERLTELMSHWAPASLLNALVSKEPRVDAQLDQYVGNLQALLIGYHLEGKGVSPKVRFKTPPSLYDLRTATRIQVRGVPEGQKVEWDFAGNSLTLRHAGGAPIQLPLPLANGGPVERTPLTWSKSWNVPIIEDNAVLGIVGTTPQELRKEVEDPNWEPLSLHDSAEAAYRIIADLWPEMLDWSPLLCTGLVDMNGPRSPHVHRSASYGPASPIFVTRVDDPFKHAGDIVHELQHQRMHLIMDTSAFGKWNDPTQNTASPYRSDPRPMRGLHLGIHAFLAVNRLRLRQHARAESPDEHYRYLLNAHRINLFTFRTLLEFEDIRPHGRPMFAEYARELLAQHELIEPMASREMSETFDTHMRAHIQAVAGRASEKILNTGPEFMDWAEIAKLAARYAEREGLS